MGIVALCPMAIVALGLRPWATIAIGHRATIPIVALGGYDHGHIIRIICAQMSPDVDDSTLLFSL